MEENDILHDIEPTPHYKLHPKSRITFWLLMALLSVAFIYGIIRLIRLGII